MSGEAVARMPDVVDRLEADRLAVRIIDFFNVAFGRKTSIYRPMLDAVYQALVDGYQPDDLRIAYWVARCLTGKGAWLGEKLRADMLPHIVLRHSGAINTVTGKESVRWLDDLLARKGEMNREMAFSLLDKLDGLDPEMAGEERDLLERMGIGGVR